MESKTLQFLIIKYLLTCNSHLLIYMPTILLLWLKVLTLTTYLGFGYHYSCTVRLMLTMNLWPYLLVCVMGATGKVVDFMYQHNHQLPDLHVAVVDQFDDYRGPVH